MLSILHGSEPRHPFGEGFIHLDRLPGNDVESYQVRAWTRRILIALVIDAATGQPWQKYNGTCVLSVDAPSRAAEVRGILQIPDGFFWKFRSKLVHEYKITALYGERWIDGVKYPIWIPLIHNAPKPAHLYAA
jgi:hypothetical protein